MLRGPRSLGRSGGFVPRTGDDASNCRAHRCFFISVRKNGHEIASADLLAGSRVDFPRRRAEPRATAAFCFDPGPIGQQSAGVALNDGREKKAGPDRQLVRWRVQLVRQCEKLLPLRGRAVAMHPGTLQLLLLALSGANFASAFDCRRRCKTALCGASAE